MKNVSAGRNDGFLRFRKYLEKSIAKRRLGAKGMIRIVGFALLVCVLTVSVFKVYRKAEPIAISALENVVGGWLEETVAYAVRSELQESEYSWDDFCTKVVGADGSIASINANTANISVMCSDVIARINREIEDQKYIKIRVPIGSVISPKYFSGKGFPVVVRAVPYVSVSAKITSEMTEAGINQTLHRIVMTVNSDVHVICMSESISFVRESSIPLTESLIVGKIPVVS